MDIQDFRKRLPISKHRLDDELEVNGELQEQISAEVARRNSRMLNAKNFLAQTEARILQDVKEGAAKITKDEAEAQVIRHKDRRDAFDIYQAAREELEEWQGLLEAWKQRGRDLRDLGQMFIASYFTVTQISGGERTPRPRRRPGLPD